MNYFTYTEGDYFNKVENPLQKLELFMVPEINF